MTKTHPRGDRNKTIITKFIESKQELWSQKAPDQTQVVSLENSTKYLGHRPLHCYLKCCRIQKERALPNNCSELTNIEYKNQTISYIAHPPRKPARRGWVLGW